MVIKLCHRSNYLNWWEPKSTCDKVGGQDGGTLPPLVSERQYMEMFIDLMCRKIDLRFKVFYKTDCFNQIFGRFEKKVVHHGLESLRFIPPTNALGSHTDPDPKKRNRRNSCYCLEDQGFSCFKSGVLNLAPCKGRFIIYGNVISKH